MATDGITALDGLDKALGLKAGESILILGAGGGVGHLAVQLAKRMNARVLAVASGEYSLRPAQSLAFRPCSANTHLNAFLNPISLQFRHKSDKRSAYP